MREQEYEEWSVGVAARAREGVAHIDRGRDADDPLRADDAPYWEALGRLGEPGDRDERSDAELLAATLERLTKPAEHAALDELLREPADDARPRPPWLLVTVVVAAAAAALIAFTLPAGSFERLLGARGDAGSLDRSAASMVATGGDELQPVELTRPEGPRPRRASSGARPELESAPALGDEDVEMTEETGASAEEDAAEEVGEQAGEDTDDSSPPAPTARAADELLARAQAMFASGERAAARRLYRELVRSHPNSPEADAARVTLGRHSLASGSPAAALRQFERYLKRARRRSARANPALVMEAEVGRIDALQQLGRAEDERAAIEAFLEEHPESLYSPRLRRRLAE